MKQRFVVRSPIAEQLFKVCRMVFGKRAVNWTGLTKTYPDEYLAFEVRFSARRGFSFEFERPFRVAPGQVVLWFASPSKKEEATLDFSDPEFCPKLARFVRKHAKVFFPLAWQDEEA